MLYFRILVQDMNCVAAIGVVHFSVRGFGCALFYFRKEYENMKAKKFLAVATAVTLLISLTACAGTGNEQASSADKSTSDITDSIPSSVDESSDTVTQSKEETTVNTESTTAATTSAASTEETTASTESTTAATTPAASGEESTDTVTESKAETTVGTVGTTAEIPATEAPVTTKAETIAPTLSKNERYVYDEDGNVVDKIKVKVVDGVTYTVEDKSNEQHIIGEVPLYANEPEFPYGEAITLAQIMAAFKGCNVSQQEIFEKYVKFYDPSDWYEEDGIKKGPNLDPGYLLIDPRTKRKDNTFTNTGNEEYYTMKILDDNNISYFEYKAAGIDVSDFTQVKEYIDRGEIAFVTVDKSSDYDDVWSWLAVIMGDNTIIEVYNYRIDVVLIGYIENKYITYNVVDEKRYSYNKIGSLMGL